MGMEWLTAFSTKKGIFQFHVMPFGLKNAPACFWWSIDLVLGDLLGVCVIVYMDNILVFSPDEESHKAHLSAVVEQILQANLIIKQSNCKFFKRKFIFLGNIIFEDGHTIAPDKKAAVCKYATLVTVFQLCSFLGTCTFLKKFTPHLLEVTASLYLASG